jgi:signal transduction histidine kinase
MGFSNTCCLSSGQQLLESLNKNPSIIFLDYYLGDYEASGLLEKIKTKCPNTYVVILSSQTEMEVAIGMLNNGAFDYIVKNEYQLQKISAVLGRLIAADDYSQKLKITATAKDNNKMVKIIIEAQEKVRKELSGELHDNISQLLGAGKLYIDLYLKNAKTCDSANLQMLDQSKSIIETAISEVKKLSRNLNAGFIKNLRLKDALLSLLDSMQQQHSISVSANIRLDELPVGLTPRIQHESYRIIQELMNNVILHAFSKHVHIEAFVENNLLLLKVIDDGVGFDKNEFTYGEGLTNIVKRINELQGLFTINSSPGEGCNWNIQLPLFTAELNK